MNVGKTVRKVKQVVGGVRRVVNGVQTAQKVMTYVGAVVIAYKVGKAGEWLYKKVKH